VEVCSGSSDQEEAAEFLTQVTRHTLAIRCYHLSHGRGCKQLPQQSAHCVLQRLGAKQSHHLDVENLDNLHKTPPTRLRTARSLVILGIVGHMSEGQAELVEET
jgi:hypothetical protein